MLSNSLYQPQVVAALSQFTSLLNSRTCTSTSTYRRISSKRASTERKQKTSTSDKLTDEVKKVNEKLCLTADNLLALPSQISIEELSPILSLIKNVKTASHVSAETFFENKNGFPESCLGDVAIRTEVQRILQTDNFRKFLSNTSLCYQQRRGFKTKRSTVPSQPSLLETYTNLTKMWKPASSEKLNKMLEGSSHDKNLQDQLKIAFAEGYSVRGQSGKKDSPYSFFRIFTTILIFYFTFQALKAVIGMFGKGKDKDKDKKKSKKSFIRGMSNDSRIRARQHLAPMGLSEAHYDCSSGMGGLGILGQQHFEINPEEIHITFDDVKGVDTAKGELHDVVDFLKDPQKYTSLGAKLPKGVLLIGAPGVGKTLLARAVAGEAGVPFFQCSGSEFDEMYVGLGAKRVRDLFKQAKTKGPCVIFIDEIDSVGSKRTSSAVHPYANQTINQLLSEMDGFAQNDGIIVLGATNRVDNLDKALRRPGRFDVEVHVHSPDLKGRTEILELYLNKVKCDPKVKAEEIAKGTIGFSGADLQNLVNQATLKAALDGKPLVTMDHLDFARDKIIMGPENKHKIPDEKTNWITAYHEAGHTLVAFFTEHATPIHKVTINPRGQSLGHTSFIPDKEQYNQTKAELLAELDVAMGGRVAEEIIYGIENVTTGALSDFQKATSISTAMVMKFGMSEKIGVRYFEETGIDIGTTLMATTDRSPAVQEQIDAEIKRLLQESYERAKNILKANSNAHKRLATLLMKHETLDKDEIKAIVEGRKFNKKM